jgi:hypothetical protein
MIKSTYYLTKKEWKELSEVEKEFYCIMYEIRLV